MSLFSLFCSNQPQEQPMKRRIHVEKQMALSIHVHNAEVDLCGGYQKTRSNSESWGDHIRRVLTNRGFTVL